MNVSPINRLRPESSRAPLFDHQIVSRPHHLVRAGGVNFHFGAGELVEEIRRAPGVNQFASAVDSLAIVFAQKMRLFAIVAVEGGGDFWIGAHGIAAEHRGVGMKNRAHVFHHGFRREIGELRRVRNGGG